MQSRETVPSANMSKSFSQILNVKNAIIRDVTPCGSYKNHKA
jgi:hypothetical protein